MTFASLVLKINEDIIDINDIDVSRFVTTTIAVAPSKS